VARGAPVSRGVGAQGVAVSRRLVNLSYVLWTVAYNASALLAFALAEALPHFVAAPGRGALPAPEGFRGGRGVVFDAAPAAASFTGARRLNA